MICRIGDNLDSAGGKENEQQDTDEEEEKKYVAPLFNIFVMC